MKISLDVFLDELIKYRTFTNGVTDGVTVGFAVKKCLREKFDIEDKDIAEYIDESIKLGYAQKLFTDTYRIVRRSVIQKSYAN